MAADSQHETSRDGYVFELTGGALCLDFVNTLGDRPRAVEEHLNSYRDLLAWSRQAGVLGESDRTRLGEVANAAPGRAASALQTAVELRETLFAIFSALAADERPEALSLDHLNAALGDASIHLRVEDSGSSIGWVWEMVPDRLDSMLWPVVRSAADLLTSDEAQWVRQCASLTCSWLFVDRSRTRRRRWCDMKTCGNRAKVRRHYLKKKRDRQSVR